MSEDKAPKKTSKKQIIDVQEPGASSPSSTSKPVIVTNRPILKDPMMVENDSADEPAEKPVEKKELKRTGETTVQPLSAPALPDEKPAADSKPAKAKPATTGEPAKKPGAEEVSITPEAEDKKPEKLETKSAAEDKPEPPAKPAEDKESSPSDKPDDDDQAPAKPADEPDETADDQDMEHPDQDHNADAEAEKKLEAEAAEQAKKDAATQQLIDSKKYALPINSVEQRKTKRFVALGIFLAILLAVAWADVALDAGLVHISGIKPVTHFFSN